MSQDILNKLPDVLLPWYHQAHRQLPWRQTRDPYAIWVSEIMLQQTRVEAVKAYYARFMQHLPTIQSLAASDDDRLYKLWEGLGYYSRVRNLKKAAQIIVEEYNGQFPEEYAQVLALPGIGAYTAGAICSIAFGQKTPAVDGNVLRVISRLTDDDTPVDKQAFKRKVNDLLIRIYPDEAGEFTQALMELGATLCGPNRPPECSRCPCAELCRGYSSGRAKELPVRQPKRRRREEEMTVFIFSCNEKYAVEKRESAGLLAQLWQFPNVAGKLSDDQAVLKTVEYDLVPVELLRQVERKHIFTHIQWNMRGYYIAVKEEGGPFKWMEKDDIRSEAALPTAFRQFFDLSDMT